MSERSTEATEVDPRAVPGPARRAIIAGGGALALAALLWGALHVVVPPVAPGRPAPAGHWSAPCWTCHFVVRGATSGGGG